MRLWHGVVLGTLVPAAALAGTLRVPTDYATIQGALDVSGVGDTVLVAPGTYSDFTIVDGLTAEVADVPDGVVLRSEAGPAVTTIDLGPLEGVAAASVAFDCSYHVSGLTVIDGFRVTGFPATSSGGAAIGQCARVTVVNCAFEATDPPDPDFYYRVGVYSYLSEVHVIDCSFIRCSANVGAGITHIGGALTVEGCTFIECANQGIRGIEGTGSPTNSLTVRDCVFEGVTSTADGGCIAGTGLTVLVEGCVFDEPRVDGSAGAAMAFGGQGSRVIRNNVVRDMNLVDGAACIFVIGGANHIHGNTFWNCHEPPQPSWSASVVAAFSTVLVTFENNIVAHTSGAKALALPSGATLTLGCNVFWDNVDGIGYPLDPTDRIADPLFCDEATRDLTLHASSPCLPANSLGCGLIGALGQGCGTVSVEAQSWGKTKSAYRSEEE